ncbi:hypothetical protein GCM10010441_58770 [Kitasatospora paracochleata]|uniref:RimJ/RimL family protein N-acetyltransferase n=1 Tax=Kitasatospora paracochleata TaxID=58354 RepID=A0ABT1J4B3_9ACTN|nr:GNAT family N-acetyltransferase [Kitasatospora paracochleata]MCP2312255.1 RimJ/RimL family protein N-acetyltransferase [Kitasatospora paracochleata]
MNDLLTGRLIIRPLTAADAETIVADEAGSHPDWAPDYPAPGERIGARMFLKACAAIGDPQPFGNYEIRLRDHGTAIGGIGFHGGPDENGAVEVGYGLAESARGQGYAREALAAVVELARSHGAAAVLADTTHDNVPSQRVLLAAGLELVRQDDDLQYYRLAL